MTSKSIKNHFSRPAGSSNDYEAAEKTRVLGAAIVPELVRAAPRRMPTDRVHAVRKPRLEGLLASAYATASAELTTLEAKTAGGEVLSEAEVKRYAILVDSVAKLARAEKESTKGVEELSEEELLELAAEYFPQLKGGA